MQKFVYTSSGPAGASYQICSYFASRFSCTNTNFGRYYIRHDRLGRRAAELLLYQLVHFVDALPPPGRMLRKILYKTVVCLFATPHPACAS